MTVESTAKKERRVWPLHPLLFAAFPILTLFNANLGEIAPVEVLRPLLIMLAAAILLWGLFTMLLRNADRAALLCSFILLLFFLYGHVRVMLLQSSWQALADCGQDHAFLLRPWFGVLLLGAVLILRIRRNLRALSGLLNVVGATLVILPLFGIGKVLLLPRIIPPAPPPEVIAVTTKAKVQPEDLPNIYYVILDGYARQDTLQRIFKYDNTPFLTDLEERGFFVARHSRTNYSQTDLSLPSALNMTYFDGGNPLSVPVLMGFLEDNDVFRELRRYGYRIISFDTEYHMHLKSADRFIAFPEEKAPARSAFDDLLISLTPLAALPLPEEEPAEKSEMNPYERHRQRIDFQLANLPRVAGGSGPTFVFAHILCPHPPFVLGNSLEEDPNRPYDIRDGSFYQTVGGSLEEYLTGYPRQVDRLNDRLIEVVDRLLKKAKRPTVIILQSDHGSGAYTNWAKPQQTDFQERMRNLLAIYTPGTPIPELYDGITPVNIFRVLFNHYLHADYPILPDKSYFSTTGRPNHFIDVTEKVK